MLSFQRLCLTVTLILTGFATAATASPCTSLEPAMFRTPAGNLDQQTANTIISAADVVVLAENHYSTWIQCQEATVIRQLAQVHNERDFTVAWEFLNATDQPQIDRAIERMRSRDLDAAETLRSLGLTNEGTYEPVIEASLAGRLIGINLPRTEKRKVVDGGLEALPPDLIPPGFTRGSELYFMRFAEAMGGMGGHGQTERYFLAQTLTDEFMAHIVDQLARNEYPVVVVVGAFHAEYGLGMIEGLRRRLPTDRSLVTVRITDDSELPLVDAVYGEIADIVVTRHSKNMNF